MGCPISTVKNLRADYEFGWVGDVLTLAILAVLVASCDRVHTVAGGAVGGRAIGLR